MSLTPSIPAATSKSPIPIPVSDAQAQPILQENSGHFTDDRVSVQTHSSQHVNTGVTALPAQIQTKPTERRRRTVLPSEELRVSVEQATIEPNFPIPTTEINENTTQAESAQSSHATQPKSRLLRLERSNHCGGNTPADFFVTETQHGGDNATPDRTLAINAKTQNRSRTGQKRSRKAKAYDRRQAIEDAAVETTEKAIQGSATNPSKCRRRPKRSLTPEDAEYGRIAPTETRMIELCRDNRIGRKSSREQELREMDRAASIKIKELELQKTMQQADSSIQNDSDGPYPIGENHQEEQVEREQTLALNVPNTIIVNGQIQIDEDSLHIDRHAAAAVERTNEELEPVDENDLSRKTTSASWLRRDKRGGWNEILLDRFYQGLRMFGTDFELISKMFPGKSRHTIKLKFCREEKLDHAKIKAALLGEKVPVVLEEYEKMTGLEYEDPRELERIMEEDRKKMEEEQAAEKQSLEEAQLERKSQAAAEKAARSEESGKESAGTEKKTKVQKGKAKQRQLRSKKQRSRPGGSGVLNSGDGKNR